MYKTVINVGIPFGKMNLLMDCVQNAALTKSTQVILIGQGMIKKNFFQQLIYKQYYIGYT